MAGQIDIFILMAGIGRRFKDQGYDTPKPLVKFKGEPLFAWAIRSVKPLLPYCNLHLVVCGEDDIQNKVETELAKLKDFSIPTAQIITIPKRTSGPLDTALKAVRQTSAADKSNPVIFCDCDLYFESGKWISGIKGWLEGRNAADGLLATYSSAEDKNSYVKLDSSGLAVEVAEKKVISTNAIAGFYAFKTASLFLKTGNSVILNQTAISNEYYISQVYSELIKTGHKVQAYDVEKIILLGTPEKVEEAENK